MNDIYYKLGFDLLVQGYDQATIDEKKEMINRTLKNYIISKLEERTTTNYLKDIKKNDTSVTELLEVLATTIPKDEHSTTLNHFTHYILNLAGNIQLHSITWWQEQEKNLIELPLVEFDDYGKWDTLKTHEQTDYVKTFSFVYDIFQNKFMIQKCPVKKIGQAPTKNPQ